MKEECGMCGERQAEQELCRTENHNERWSVCRECARLMLDDPHLSRMWQKAAINECCLRMAALA